VPKTLVDSLDEVTESRARAQYRIRQLNRVLTFHLAKKLPGCEVVPLVHPEVVKGPVLWPQTIDWKRKVPGELISQRRRKLPSPAALAKVLLCEGLTVELWAGCQESAGAAAPSHDITKKS